MDYRDSAAYWWQGLMAAAMPTFLVGMFMMASNPSVFPIVAFIGVAMVAIAIFPWAICMADDRPVNDRKGGWL